MIFVQIISADWGKGGRHGCLATLRSRIPFALPTSPRAVGRTPATCLVERIAFVERDDFQVPHRQPLAEVRIRMLGGPFYPVDENVLVRIADDLLHIDLPWFNGAPLRRQRIDLFTLATGNSWGRVRYNYRSSDSDGNWSYRQRAINIAYGMEPDLKLFMTTESAHEYVDFAILK